MEQMIYNLWRAGGQVPEGKVRVWMCDGQDGGVWADLTPEHEARLLREAGGPCWCCGGIR